ncbi:MAG: histidine kinase dimerization/phospho-acceptor domain-containing protein, partial [Bacteroidota bacterium]
MKRLKRLYLLPILLALMLGVGLMLFFFPRADYVKVLLCITLPMVVLGIGFRIIAYQRIKIIRAQLYQILQTLEEFDVDEPRKVAFDPSPFPIFNELNEYLIELIDRIRNNYQANKQFTQNASHELQTPLAVIKGHVELLLQSPNLRQKEIESLGIVMQNTNRLARLNSALILLSKIEHQRFGDTEQVDFTKVSKEVLHNFKDLIEIQELHPQLL